MPTRSEERYGVPPRRSGTLERVLAPGGRQKLTLEQLEKQCLARLTALVSRAAIWPSDGYRESWRVGDFNILIVETTVAPNASLYVQFWSEPNGPVDWEVSSGNMNPGAQEYITDQVRARLGEMGFTIGGAAGNYGKRASIVNRGDAAAVARDVLRIFHVALGYRGATPLVAKFTKGERSARSLVHTRFSVSDAATLLQQLGYQTKMSTTSKVPTVYGRRPGFEFAVILANPSPSHGEFHCLDFGAPVGHITDGAHAAWGEAINRLNGISRVARGWIDSKGNVIVGTSLNLAGGMTEDAIAYAVAGWDHAAESLLGGPPKPKRRRTGGKPLEGTDVGGGRPRARPVVH